MFLDFPPPLEKIFLDFPPANMTYLLFHLGLTFLFLKLDATMNAVTPVERANATKSKINLKLHHRESSMLHHRETCYESSMI